MRALCILLLTLALALPCMAAARADAPGELVITFFGTESADAILLCWPDGAAMIDTGLNKYGPRIAAELETRGITRLDALIITHFDKDHVGGADSVLAAVEVGRLLTADSEKDSKQYRQFLEAAEAAGVPIERVTEDLVLELPGLSLNVNAPKSVYEQENDRSLVIRAEWGACSFLFAGDAENDRLGDLLATGVGPCTLLKVPHHGRVEKLSEAFFRAASPKFAVITSSEEEPADDVVVGMLEALGAECLFTCEGDITVRCDGASLSISQE